MERLTIRNSDGTVSQPTNTTVEQVFYRLAEYEDTGLEPEEIGEMKTAYDENQMPYAIEATGSEAVHIYKLLLAEAQGRLLVLPCRAGDTVYAIDWYLDCDIDGFGVCDGYKKEGDRACGYCRHNYVKKFVREKKYEHPMLDEIGKTVFLTREEAETAIVKEGRR